MSAKAATILNQALDALNDPRAEHWSLDELLGYLNAGLRLLVRYMPDQFSRTEVITLVSGARQTLPAFGVKVVSVIAAVDNGVPVRSVRRVDLMSLHAHDPSWLSADSGHVREWAEDLMEPNVFWVNPPQPSPAYDAQISYVQEPVEQELNSILPVDVAFEPPLLEYVLYRAYSKDADYAGQDGRAMIHYTKFMEAVGAAN